MEPLQINDVIERLFVAASHPDIVSVERYGRDAKLGGQSPAGVAVTYRSGSAAFLSPALPGNPAPQPHDLPDELPPLRFRAQHALKFVLELLDFAKPSEFTAWRPVAFADAGLKPSGIEIRCNDGTTAYVRVTSGSGSMGDPDHDEFADYVIPGAVRNV